MKEVCGCIKNKPFIEAKFTESSTTKNVGQIETKIEDNKEKYFAIKGKQHTIFIPYSDVKELVLVQQLNTNDIIINIYNMVFNNGTFVQIPMGDEDVQEFKEYQEKNQKKEGNVKENEKNNKN